MALKVIINKDRCIGCANCTLILPEVFAISPDGHSTIRDKYRLNSELEGIVPDEFLDAMEEVVSKCLGSAISFIHMKKENQN